MLNIPNSWLNITINDYIYINNSIKDNGVENSYIDILSYLCNVSHQTIEELEYEEFLKLVNQLSFLKTTPKNRPSTILKFDEEDLFLIDFNQLEIGAFIDLEYFITNDYINNLKIILSILYRRKTIHNSLFIIDELEPYGNWINHRANLFSDISIVQVYGVIQNYLNFREDFFKKYDGLLSGPVEDDEEDNMTNKSTVQRAEEQKEKQKEKSVQKWGWNVLLYQLANNDPLKISEASSMNLIEAFNILSMKRELGL